MSWPGPARPSGSGQTQSRPGGGDVVRISFWLMSWSASRDHGPAGCPSLDREADPRSSDHRSGQVSGSTPAAHSAEFGAVELFSACPMATLNLWFSPLESAEIRCLYTWGRNGGARGRNPSSRPHFAPKV
jgi:hypothetical protein